MEQKHSCQISVHARKLRLEMSDVESLLMEPSTPLALVGTSLWDSTIIMVSGMELGYADSRTFTKASELSIKRSISLMAGIAGQK